ncbi:ABC transporter ATP-binding protein [Solimicrobium silvestre]|uniref:ABC-type sugar transport systems ATPase component n=1 Tax=Solimicrobium silvestre TaxID=2099400 RepID=A0A2S9GXX6_9BURK|nr:sn-glycerol-3-phosphate ABC transporter ATP-binding protein UgpC [Solimicrobium silvestre]PRC92561.1 ABC-type sugar transport systems ATPase component [Solimicrobium silvestre]
MAAVQLKQIYKKYDDTQVLHGIDLDIADGEFVVLVGPSGCGKSTLMRMVAGLESISDGDFYIDGKRANDLPPQQRNIAMVFQSYALYPHLTVYENIAFGPRLRKEPESSFGPRIKAAAAMLNLSPYLQRLPKALSGGQRQRVAMGRAVVREPALFLFDEPLSNLDAKLRVQMRAEIKALHQRLKNTVIYVTHDQIEAITMGDRIVVMNAGKIEQVGKPLDIYDRPANLFVAGFIGSPSMNFIAGTVQIDANQPSLITANDIKIKLPQLDLKAGQKITIGIRPEHIRIERTNNSSNIKLRLDIIEPTGSETYLYGKIDHAPCCIALRERLNFAADDEIQANLPIEHLHVFDTETTCRIN